MISADEITVAYYQSPIGILLLRIKESSLIELNFLDDEKRHNESLLSERITETSQILLKQIAVQLDEYFSGKRKVFDIPIQQNGTIFQQKVWQALIKIPFGKTISYLQLSRNIGNVKSIRAVGSANGRNNIAIIVPCHRVIGSNGSLTGYAGGLWRKQWLLNHENKYDGGQHLLFDL